MKNTWPPLTALICTTCILLLATPVASAISLFGLPLGSGGSLSSQIPVGTSTVVDGHGISNSATNFMNSLLGDANENTCLMFSNHQYEVCTAYIFNASIADLLPYYSYSRSNNASLSRLVSYRLESRYEGQANSLVRERVMNWPAGNYDVDLPIIKILSINASLATNSATLQTQESWRAADESGKIMYAESNTPHTITMERIPSYLLHKWVVTSIH